MQVNLQKTDLSDRQRLGNLLQFYMYDFTDFLDLELNDDGRYNEYVLDDYFRNPEKTAFIVLANEKLAGFVLVSTDTILAQNKGGRCIKEFFIVRKYRRKGLGRMVAAMTWDLYPGKWEMKVEPTNKPAQKFWESAIRDYPNKEAFKKEEQTTGTWQGFVFSLVAYRE